ncbi:DUF4179 domain-containing protein [Paenibacillus contaminans]|nr:DUF4179 domain-containing protein [Paenibacillus contaminans]
MSEAFHTDELELKRKFNETKLPQIQLKARVLDELEAGSRHMAPRPARSRKLLTAVCSVMAAVAVLGALSAFPASADQLRKIPVVGKIFEGNIFSFAGDSGIVSGQQSGLSSGLNEEASDKGVTIKLQDVIYDGARLSISYEMNSEKPDHLLFLGDVDVKINGIPNLGATLGTKPHRINERRSVGIMTLDLEEPERAGSFDLELTIGEVTGFKEEDPVPKRILGQWSFKLTVANSTAESAYKTLADGHTAKSEDRQFQLTGYLATPATTQLDFRYAGDTKWLSFQLKDDRDMLIETLDSRFTTGKDGVTNGTVRFAPLAGGTKTIKVTPYMLSVGKKESEKVTAKLTDAFPIVLSQGEVGEAIVKNVEFLHDKTLIYYEVKGKVPYMQYASLWLETEDGQILISDNGKRTRIGGTSYDYILEYPALDPQESYVLGTMPQTDIKLLDELTVTLDVEE